MAKKKKPAPGAGLENVSVSSSRRSGQKRDGTSNPASRDGKPNSTESTCVQDKQIAPVTGPDGAPVQ